MASAVRVGSKPSSAANQLEHPALDAAGVIDPVESSIDPKLHLAPELF